MGFPIQLNPLEGLEEASRGAVRCCQSQARERRRTRKPLIRLEPAIGLEPMTCALRVRCSTTELRRPAQA